MLVFLF